MPKKEKDLIIHEKPSPQGVCYRLELFPCAVCKAKPGACAGYPSSLQGNLVTIAETAYVGFFPLNRFQPWKNRAPKNK